MKNKKYNNLYFFIGFFLVFILIFGGYIVYDKLLSDDKNSIDNNTSENDNSTTNNDNVVNNNNEEQETCDKNYSIMYNDKYIYKVKVTNKSGAMVYDNYMKSAQNVIETLETGKEFGVVADIIDTMEFYAHNQKEKYDGFDEIKNYYYFVIDVCGEPKYIKYSDVEIIESSIVTSQKFSETLKFYVHSDEYLYSGPGLSFERNNKDEKIYKGTILDVNVYSRIGNALWLYVNSNGQNGWILREVFNSANYPYNNMKYGSAVELDEEIGEIYIANDENLYKYAFSTDNIISKIPKGTKVSYDYITSEPGISYYHINYNDNSGWISIIN